MSKPMALCMVIDVHVCELIGTVLIFCMAYTMELKHNRGVNDDKYSPFLELLCCRILEFSLQLACKKRIDFFFF